MVWLFGAGALAAATAIAAWYGWEWIADLYHEHLRGEVCVRIEATPSTSEVFVDGDPAPSGRIVLRRSNRTHLVRVRAPGYRTEAFHVRAHRSQTYTVRLIRRPARARSRGKRRGARSQRCPAAMVHVTPADDEGFCIERFEHPGRGRLPRRGVSLAQARDACHARGARLCTVEEWITACGVRFPYGRAYSPGRCNTNAGGRLVAAGSRRRCRSRWGVHDLSGNVSEWVQGGVHLGGDASQSGGMVSCRSSNDQQGPLTGFRCCADLPWE